VAGIDDSTVPATFTFKGDANRGEDTSPVPASAIRGKVWFHVPYLGAVRDSVQGKAGLGLLAMLMLSAYALSQVVSAVRERKGRPQVTSPATAADGDHLPTQPQPSEQVWRLGQTLVVARFDHSASGDHPLEAQGATQEWNAVVVDHDDAGFTLLLAAEAHLLDLTLEVLAMHNPVHVEVFAGPSELRTAAAAAVTA
jgi:hypothetical protein